MRITYLSDAQFKLDEQKRFTSDLASARYRCLIPSSYIKKICPEAKIIYLNSQELTDDDYGKKSKFGTHVVVGKVFQDLSGRLERLKGASRKVILDLCDDHFSHGTLGPIYTNHLKYADHIVVATSNLAEKVRGLGYKATVISDPYDKAFEEPQYNRGDQVKMVWFGHHINLDALVNNLPNLSALAKREEISLIVIAGKGPSYMSLARLCDSLRIDVTVIRWEDELVNSVLTEADMALLPVLNNDKYICKSPNRIIKALSNGVIPISTYIHSDAGLSDYAVVNTDVAKAVEFVLSLDEETYKQRTREGQIYIAKNYSPEKIAQQWLDVIKG